MNTRHVNSKSCADLNDINNKFKVITSLVSNFNLPTITNSPQNIKNKSNTITYNPSISVKPEKPLNTPYKASVLRKVYMETDKLSKHIRLIKTKKNNLSLNDYQSSIVFTI